MSGPMNQLSSVIAQAVERGIQRECSCLSPSTSFRAWAVFGAPPLSVWIGGSTPYPAFLCLAVEREVFFVFRPAALWRAPPLSASTLFDRSSRRLGVPAQRLTKADQ